MGNGILPSLTPREDCYQGQRWERRRDGKAACRVLINSKIAEARETSETPAHPHH